MNQKEFEEVVDKRLAIVKNVLQIKAQEYAKVRAGQNPNRMHNFYRAAGLLGSTAVAALQGMWVKHVVSINDIVDDIEAGRPVKRGLVEEKLTDNIAYLLLLDGLLANEPLVVPDGDAREYIESLHMFDDTPTKYFKGHSPDFGNLKPLKNSIRRCRVCGCTDNDCRQCIEKTGEPCCWVESDLCSACVKPQLKKKKIRREIKEVGFAK